MQLSTGECKTTIPVSFTLRPAAGTTHVISPNSESYLSTADASNIDNSLRVTKHAANLLAKFLKYCQARNKPNFDGEVNQLSAIIDELMQ